MSKIFDEIEVSQEVKNFVDRSMEISDQIAAILKKQDKTQRDLAELLGKKESEISKWMTGMHNFTIKSIAKIEAVLGEQVLMTPESAPKTKFVRVSVTAHSNQSRPSGNYEKARALTSTDKTVLLTGIKVA